MKIDAFFNYWLGRKIDYDGAYGYQCVDWVRQYSKEVVQCSLGSFWGSALAGWKNNKVFDEKWQRHEYTPGTFPLVGDILFFWGTAKNPYGHTAVAGYASNSTSLCLFEQNAGSGNGDGVWTNAILQKNLSYQQLGSRWPLLGWYRYIHGATLSIKNGIWSGNNPYAIATRQESALFFSRSAHIDESTIWNKQNGWVLVSENELAIMSVRAYKQKTYHTQRQDIAIFCYLHQG